MKPDTIARATACNSVTLHVYSYGGFAALVSSTWAGNYIFHVKYQNSSTWRLLKPEPMSVFS